MDRQSPNDDSEIGVALGTPPPPSKVQLTEYTDTMEDTIPLDEYQKQLLKRARHENLIIALPTSDDKSNIAVALIRQMFHQTEGQYPQVARRTVFLSPTRILIEQHYETLKRWIKAPVVLLHGDTDEVDRGEESMQLWANHQVLLLTPRTFIKCITLGIIQFENLNLLIFDEAHEALPGTKSEYRQILEAFHAQCVHQPACHQPRIIALSTVTFLRQIKHKNIDAAIAQMTTIYQTKLETQVISGNHLDADHILISRVDDDRVFGPRRDAKLPSEVFNQMLDYLSTDDAQNVVTKKVLKKVESLCTQKMGPWFAVEALEIYKNTLLCNIELYQLRPDLLPILELFQLALCLQFRETEWTDLDFALKSATSEKLTALLKCIRTFGRCLNCIVFVREVIIANVIYRWIRLLSRKVPELGFIKVGFARGNMKHLFVKLTDNTYSFIRYDESTSRFKERFEEGELNLLVATSALEEG